ncbi:ABC transporter permease [Reichenbachiella carrageenanivorans]|uniref:ABC transporter permease n=1 Tax=Reichenbachiella carrageenanivorans TaxID=2979869 RepID=A0ABY6CYG0_9BACT|nr:ABC transporter permease [Reichenbachiella carrageenanivorans]UXX78908.1 ABC transporter permease [Reichenbachiella carrageenanivorans]
MLKNFYLTAIRNMLKHKSYFLINICGLAIGIASFIFIALYIINEMSYDKFHSQSKNIHRVHVKGQMMGQTMDMAVTATPMAQALISEYPEVSKVTRVKESGAWFIGRDNKKFNEDGVLFADSTFFDVFDFKFLSGNKKTALIHPRSVVLTASYAKKYFGNEDPIGQKLTVEQDSIFYTVTGVMEDVPDHSHIQFDMMGSLSTYPHWLNNQQWVSHNNYTYVVLHENANISALEDKLQALVYKYVGPQVEQYLGTTMDAWESAGNSFGYYLMPLEDIYLYSNVDEELEANSDISYIYIYSLIAIILLFIAIINFVNLATAQSSSRAKEVGIRKVVGSSKQRLIGQFIFESIVISSFATIVAGLLVFFLTPAFTQLIGKEIAYQLTSSLWSFFWLGCLAILIGVLAGFYPAFILAAYQPVDVLKGTMSAGAKASWMRNLLVVIQFTAAIIIIIGTVVVYNQIDFMLNKNLGFNKEQIVVIRRSDVLRNNLETFKNDLLQNPNIKEVANAMSLPGKDRYNNNAHMTEESPDSPYLLYENHVSFGYAELMNLELVEGRFFSKDHPSDSSGVIINESAVKTIGYTDPIGKKFLNPDDDGPGKPMTIIGVVKDYHIESLHKRIEPTMLRLMAGNWEGYVTVKLSNTHNVRETIQFIENTWFDHSYNKPFQYFFFDDDYANLYNSESTTGQVFVVFASLSIFIACLGLIGLVTYTAAIRKKEIGIRKVLGASTSTLIKLLSNEIVKLIVISTLIAWPLAYLATDYWLQNFADRLSISPWIYLGSTFIVVFIGSLAISFQTIKASRSNPVDSLRQD